MKKLNSKDFMYLVKLINIHTNEVINTNELETIKEAKKVIRKIKKENELIIHAGHLVNYKKGLEIITNF